MAPQKQVKGHQISTLPLLIFYYPAPIWGEFLCLSAVCLCPTLSLLLKTDGAKHE